MFDSKKLVQNLDLAKIAITLLIVFLGATAFGKDKTPQNDCDPAKPATEDNALMLSLLVAEQIAAVEKEFKAKGQELRMVLVARGASQSLEHIEVLGNNNFVKPDRTKSRIQVDVPQLPYDMTANEFAQSAIYKEIRQACKKYSTGQHGPKSSASSSRNFRQECIEEGVKFGALPREPGIRSKLDYFHVGIALKNHPSTDPVIPGWWGMVHELKPSCRRHDQEEFQRKTFNKEMPWIYEESMKSYFLESLKEYKAIVIVPSLELQRKVEELIWNKERRLPFVGTRYNAAALTYQNGRRNDQNSNQWVAEILAAAQDEAIKNRQQAQELLRAQSFMPTKINYQSDFMYSLGSLVDGLTNFVGWDAIDSVNLDGHKLKDSGIVEIVTVRSIQNYLADIGKLVDERPIKIPQDLVVKDKEYEDFQKVDRRD